MIRLFTPRFIFSSCLLELGWPLPVCFLASCWAFFLKVALFPFTSQLCCSLSGARRDRSTTEPRCKSTSVWVKANKSQTRGVRFLFSYFLCHPCIVLHVWSGWAACTVVQWSCPQQRCWNKSWLWAGGAAPTGLWPLWPLVVMQYAAISSYLYYCHLFVFIRGFVLCIFSLLTGTDLFFLAHIHFETGATKAPLLRGRPD